MDRKCKHVKQLLWSKLQELFEVGVKAKEAQRGDRQKKKVREKLTLSGLSSAYFLHLLFIENTL